MKARIVTSIVVLIGFLAGIMITPTLNVAASDYIRVYVNGKIVNSEDAPAQIINDRTMLPVRAISEALGMEVLWDEVNRTVKLNSPVVATPEPTTPDTYPAPIYNSAPVPAPYPTNINYDIPILGESVATSEQLRTILKKNNPNAPDLVDLYLKIGKEYGIRGDLAFCQAAKETGWWRFGNLVTLDQNNYCGLGATGSAATGEENLNGANPDRIWYIAGRHGAFFKTPADGVEAQIQHLYAYATKNPLPAGKELVDPRFTLVTKGIAPRWIDLNGRWAVPGTTYGHSIIYDYLGQAIALTSTSSAPATNANNGEKTKSEYETLINELRKENAKLNAEIDQLKKELAR